MIIDMACKFAIPGLHGWGRVLDINVHVFVRDSWDEGASSRPREQDEGAHAPVNGRDVV